MQHSVDDRRLYQAAQAAAAMSARAAGEAIEVVNYKVTGVGVIPKP
jgi:predicted ribosome quality control (RQC) complex YloA/Tae2 family protein